MTRLCGDFRSVELENVKQSKMKGKHESFQNEHRPELVVGVVLGVGGFQWLLLPHGRWVVEVLASAHCFQRTAQIALEDCGETHTDQGWSGTCLEDSEVY